MREEKERINVAEFVEKHPALKKLTDLFKNKVLIEKKIDDNGIYHLQIECYDGHTYGAVINERAEKNGDAYVYFGGYMNNRNCRPFEDWHRGNDLPDGELVEKTIDRFIKAVIEWAFVDVPKETEKKTYPVQEVTSKECIDGSNLVGVTVK